MINGINTQLLLQEFFGEQYRNGLSERFASALQDDYNKVMGELNDFIKAKNLSLTPMDINFHDFILGVIHELSAFKSKVIKIQNDILVDAANRAKGLSEIRH